MIRDQPQVTSRDDSEKLHSSRHVSWGFVPGRSAFHKREQFCNKREHITSLSRPKRPPRGRPNACSGALVELATRRGMTP